MKKKEKGLSAVHLMMMALGTVIGGSFFLGSTVAIKAAGPAVTISYIIGGILVYLILFSLSEMTVANPDSGSFRTFAEHAYGRGVGFVVGWVYWTGLVLAMSSEAIALSIFLSEWIKGISIPLMGAIIIVVITMLNLIGADKLSKMESGLAFVKLLAIVGFIVLALMLIFGVTSNGAVGTGALKQEVFFPSGIGGILGSLLIVMFTYAGFEIIGLAASEADNPDRTVPKAIKYTVASLVGLYIIAITVLLPLIPIDELSQDQSPMVLALSRWNMGWAGSIMSFVLITAVFSTMLACMFGLGRMIRSLADEGHSPRWLKDKGEVPYKGIIFSGAAMLVGLLSSFVLPEKVYVFLVSSGGFALLFTYLVILVTHFKFRRENGCPKGKCQLPGFPYTSIIAIVSIVAIIVCMPMVEGQGYGLIAGLGLALLYTIIYIVKKYIFGRR